MPQPKAPVIYAQDLILTRPEPQSHRFAMACRQRFGKALRITISPLLRIVPRNTQPDLSGISGLIFTSANGVDVFAEKSGSRALTAWCVGERTAEAARKAGFRAMSADGDRHALVALLSAQAPRGRLIHLRGAETAGNLVQELANAGITATAHVIYDQIPEPVSAQACQILAGSDPVIVALFSPRTGEIAASALKGARAPLGVAAMSPAVAATIPVQSGARIEVADKPRSAAMLDAIARLRDPSQLERGVRPG